MENAAKVTELAKVCKQFIEPDKLLAVVLIPVLGTLLVVTGKPKKDLESGIELALDILRGFSKEMKKPAWTLLFNKVMDTFVAQSLEESHALQRAGVNAKEDFYHKLLKCTLKDLYFMIIESKDKEVIMDYMSFLQERTTRGDKVCHSNHRTLSTCTSKQSWMS